MSAEFWAVIGVGIAVLGLVWRLDMRFNGFDTRFNGVDTRFNALEARLDSMQTDIAGIKERLSAVEAILDLLVKGLHIEIQGRETT